MQILGVIIIITGLILILVGRNVAISLPANYQNDENDDLPQLLQSMGKLIKGAGIVFLVAGAVCVLVGFCL